MKMQVIHFLLGCFLCGGNILAQNVLETGQSFSFGPRKGKSYRVAIRPEWGVLTLRARMKTKVTRASE